ncbi:MAG: (5-formylfuran-3-yl)methyl phosphate synthase [Phycisphaeraceae bacterium]
MTDLPPRLLVSVRDAAEAEAALAGGADILDVKDPARGALGRADAADIAAVLEAADRRVAVSAAMGDLGGASPDPLPDGLAFVKMGLAGAPQNWRDRLAEAAAPYAGRFVAAAMADHSRAKAPPVSSVLQWAIRERAAGLLIDTAVKDGRGLLTWCSEEVLRRWIREARQAGLFIALAGSLSPFDAVRCLALGPDIIAVRGAACDGQDRSAAVCRERVADLKHLIESSSGAFAGRAG